MFVIVHSVSLCCEHLTPQLCSLSLCCERRIPQLTCLALAVNVAFLSLLFSVLRLLDGDSRSFVTAVTSLEKYKLVDRPFESS